LIIPCGCVREKKVFRFFGAEGSQFFEPPVFGIGVCVSPQVSQVRRPVRPHPRFRGYFGTVLNYLKPSRPVVFSTVLVGSVN